MLNTKYDEQDKGSNYALGLLGIFALILLFLIGGKMDEEEIDV